jgi:hypothetical protein
MFTFARVKGSVAILFFVSLIIIGVMFFLNIFLAILLENFGVDNDLMALDKNNSVAAAQDTENQSQVSQPGKIGVFGKVKSFVKSLFTP